MRSPLTPETVCDEKLPQLGALLDAVRMRARFASALGAGRVTDCQIIRVKYRPDRNCVVSYRLALVDETGRSIEQLLSALALGEGESRAQFISAQQQPLAPTAIGDGLFHLPELEAVVWVFPNDRKLTGLPAIADRGRLKNNPVFALVAQSLGEGWSVAALSNDVVHYVAERACTVRVNLELRNARTGATVTRVLYGKTYCLDESATAWRAMEALWMSAACQQGRLLIPQPLAYQPAIKTIWQSGLSGQTLNAHEANSSAFADLLEQAGAAVATLHQTYVPGLPLLTGNELINKLTATEALLARVHPACEPTLRVLVERLIATAEPDDARPRATLHGDLHLQNFFVMDERIALLDLDSLAQGDPLQDVGSFVAALHYRALLEGRSVAATEQAAQRFFAAYRAHADCEVPTAALNWHTAAALLYERAHRCVTRLKAGRLALLDDIIALAQQFVVSAARG